MEEKMLQEKLDCHHIQDNNGFTMLPNNFLKKWTQTLGKGPILLYLQLVTYCHKDKYIAWPALKTLGDDLGMSKTSLIYYQKILLKYGFIKRILKRNHQGFHQSNIYQLTPIECVKNEPCQVQKLDLTGTEIELRQVQKFNPNNNNLNNTNRTTTSAVVDFKKIKDKGEEKMNAIRKRMLEFDFTEGFTEKVLKEYPLEKVEEKLELYAEGSEVRNPAGWFIAALREGYGEEKVKDKVNVPPSQFRMDYSSSRNDTSCSAGLPRHCVPRNDEKKEHNDYGNRGLPRRFTPRNDGNDSRNGNEKILPREEALKRIQAIRRSLMAINSS